MNEMLLDLSDQDFAQISGLSCAEAALEIYRIHFRQVDPTVTFLVPARGADLRVRLHGVETDLEVKGTEKAGIAWNQFKVSSQQSHDLLLKAIPLYRVTEVGSRTVKIFIMKHGVDFEMSPEPRWTVHAPRRR